MAEKTTPSSKPNLTGHVHGLHGVEALPQLLNTLPELPHEADCNEQTRIAEPESQNNAAQARIAELEAQLADMPFLERCLARAEKHAHEMSRGRDEAYRLHKTAVAMLRQVEVSLAKAASQRDKAEAKLEKAKAETNQVWDQMINVVFGAVTNCPVKHEPERISFEEFCRKGGGACGMCLTTRVDALEKALWAIVRLMRSMQPMGYFTTPELVKEHVEKDDTEESTTRD
jgi:hypothetical protein